MRVLNFVEVLSIMLQPVGLAATSSCESILESLIYLEGLNCMFFFFLFFFFSFLKDGTSLFHVITERCGVSFSLNLKMLEGYFYPFFFNGFLVVLFEI